MAQIPPQGEQGPVSDFRVRSYAPSIVIIIGAIVLLPVALFFLQGSAAIAVGIGYAPVAALEGWGGRPDPSDVERARRAMVFYGTVGWSLTAIAVLGILGVAYREIRTTVRARLSRRKARR